MAKFPMKWFSRILCRTKLVVDAISSAMIMDRTREKVGSNPTVLVAWNYIGTSALHTKPVDILELEDNPKISTNHN